MARSTRRLPQAPSFVSAAGRAVAGLALLALLWPLGGLGPLRAVRELWENTVRCGGLAVSSQHVGTAIFAPPSPPGPLPTLLHDPTSPWVGVYGWSRLLGCPGPSVAVAGFLGACGLSSCSWGRQLALPQAVMLLLAPRCRLMSACELKGCSPFAAGRRAALRFLGVGCGWRVFG